MCGWKRSEAGHGAGTCTPVWLPLLCAVLCLYSLLHSGCARQEPAENPDRPAPGPRVLRISQRNEPADLDPAHATLPDEFFIIRALGEGLLAPVPLQSSTNGATRVEPAAAASWNVSDDGLTYTFRLRPDARWSNGEPLTADDFVASYRRILTPETAAPKASLFCMVKNARAFATGALADFAAVGFHASDPRTLVITLEHPLPQFPVYVASGPWIPVNPRVVERHGREWTRPDNYVGNGPFALAGWRPNQRIVVRRNPHYHAAERVKVDELHFLAFDSGDTEERAFRAGQVDVTMAVPFTKLETYARERAAELHRAPLAETRFLSFNTRRPPLDDRRVRRALALAINREKIVEAVLRGGQRPAHTFVAPMLYSTGAAEAALGRRVPSPPEFPTEKAIRSREMLPARNGVRALPHAFEPMAARQLLADAGFPDGRTFPRLELSTWGVTPQVVEALQQMWKKELGVTVAIVTREARVHMAALREGRYDLGFMTAIPDVADAANVLQDFTTAAPGNYPQWSDARFDELIAAATRTADSRDRATLLQQAEARLLDEAPLSPLYFNSINWLMSPRVHGWQPDALWTRFYLDVEITDTP